MAGKSLLLDIDGVLIRDKLLLAHVKDNCTKYVASKLPECKDPRETNRVLYLAHGHTARGLQKSFNVNTSDFNQQVYDKSVMDHLAEVIYSSDFQDEAKQIHEIAQRGWNVTLFTNSPIEWAGPIARAISDELYIKCAGPDLTNTHLKPEAKFYNDFSKSHTHIFVDDSPKNLGTARWLPNWHPVLFTDAPKDPKMWCPQVDSFWEMCMYINSVEQWIQDTV